MNAKWHLTIRICIRRPSIKRGNTKALAILGKNEWKWMATAITHKRSGNKMKNNSNKYYISRKYNFLFASLPHCRDILAEWICWQFRFMEFCWISLNLFEFFHGFFFFWLLIFLSFSAEVKLNGNVSKQSFACKWCSALCQF